MRFLNKKSGQFVTIHPRNTQGVCALLRSQDHLVIKNDDSEHWITLNGGEGEGEHILINGQGEVIGGAGGKLNGKELKDVKNKSKNVEKHGMPVPQFPPKPSNEPSHEPSHEVETKLSPLQEKLKDITKLKKEAIESKNIDEVVRVSTKLSYEIFDLKSEDDPESKKIHEELKSLQNELLSDAGKFTIENIDNLSKKSSFEDKEKALLDAKKVYNQLRENRSNETNGTFWGLYDKIKTLSSTVNKEKAKSGSAGQIAINEFNKTFEKLPIEEVSKQLKEKYNFGFENEKSKKVIDQLWKDYVQAKFSGDLVKAQELRDKYDKEKGSGFKSYVRNHTPVDITSNTKSAKQQRMIIGKVASSFDDLDSRGWDIKEAFKNAKVSYTPAGVGKSCGHAWQQDGVGYFSISHSKYYDPEYIQDQKTFRENREKDNKPKWTIGAGTDYELQATIIHEMTHALGLQSNINSPKKLGTLMQKLANEGKLTGFPTEQADMGQQKRISEFIKWKISEYATTNIKETDAELATLVTHPEYVKGTLPKELEDHVDELFKRKK